MMNRALRCLLVVALAGGSLFLAGAPAPADDETGEREESVVVVRVVDDETGRAMSGVRVVLFDAASAPLFEGETDAAGECRLSRRGAGNGAVAAFVPGYAVGHRRLVPPLLHAEREVELRLPVARPLAGRVLSARSGEPVEGASLVLRVLEMSDFNGRLDWTVLEEVERGTSDEEGRFSLERASGRGDSRGSLPLTLFEVRAEGFADVAKVLWSPARLPGDLAVLLPEGNAIRGTVRGTDGEPVIGCEVGTGHPSVSAWVDRRLLSVEDVWHSGSTLLETPPLLDLRQSVRTVTNERGEYELDRLVSGTEYVVWIRAAGTSRPTRTVPVPHGGTPARWNLGLRAGASLEVHVSRGRKTVADGVLLLRPERTLERAPGAAVTLVPPVRSTVTTDDRGAVRFEGLDPGGYRVTATGEGLGEVSETVSLRAGNDTVVHLRHCRAPDLGLRTPNFLGFPGQMRKI